MLNPKHLKSFKNSLENYIIKWSSRTTENQLWFVGGLTEKPHKEDRVSGPFGLWVFAGNPLEPPKTIPKSPENWF
jgi:hypothetical protein